MSLTSPLRAPRFEGEGPSRGNSGVYFQDHVPIPGEATTAALFKGVVPKGPLVLQDHGNPVRYRNIWLRPL